MLKLPYRSLSGLSNLLINKDLCYVVSEWLYHELGGKAAGWKPMIMRVRGRSHWFLKHRSGFILDATANQFATLPDYSKARGKGFMTKLPCRKTRAFAAKLLRVS